LTKKLITILVLCFSAFLLNAEDYRYHKVPAKPGDGAFSLLRRYDLADYSCNINQFFKLNKMNVQTGLVIGRYYKIPVLLYKYNGHTIRTTIGKDDWDLAKRIEGYNDKMLVKKNRAKDFRVDKNLWVPYHEYYCPKAKATTVSPTNGPPVLMEEPERIVIAESQANMTNDMGTSRIFPIFGKKYQKVPLIDNKLRGRVYYIVSGHGGPDPGAIGKQGSNQLCEDEYAYDVALRLTRKLVEHGATAYMIVRDPNDGIRDGKFLKCDYDEQVWGKKRIYRQQKPRLFQRSNAINKLYEKHKKQGVSYQRAIMVHVDSRNKKQQTDLFFYHTPASLESKIFAKELHKTMESKYKKYRASGEYHGTVTGRDLHMLREVKPVAAYIELGNIRNSFDQQRVVYASNREALAKWLCESLLP
jgi:N-acetylmuramoyl-L-alanine amidase